MTNQAATDRFDSHTNEISETAYKSRLKTPWQGHSNQKNQLRLMADEEIAICNENGNVVGKVTEEVVLRALKADHKVDGWVVSRPCTSPLLRLQRHRRPSPRRKKSYHGNTQV